MTFDEEYFQRAVRRFLAEVEAENRSAAAERLHEQQAKEERARKKEKEKLLSAVGEVEERLFEISEC